MHVLGMEMWEYGAFAELCREQGGAFSRGQAALHGITDKVLQRGRRRRQLQRIHPGVYAVFTGWLPWETRIWAAWLACGPDAALTGTTAIRRYGVTAADTPWGGGTGDGVCQGGRGVVGGGSSGGESERVYVALPHHRRAAPKEGVIVTRHRNLSTLVHPSRRPPTMRLEPALLVVASAMTSTSHLAAVLLDACRQRKTTPSRLRAELARLGELPGRRVLERVLADADDGVHSFLEQVYLRRVERAHGLPKARRQVRASDGGSFVYRDAEYAPYDVIVELDGQAGHADSISRWRDMSRDNAAATSGKLTLRFGYQVVGDPCSAAAQVSAALHLRGWPEPPHPCSANCSLPR